MNSDADGAFATLRRVLHELIINRGEGLKTFPALLEKV